MRLLSLLLPVGVLFSNLHAATWDPEDATFDPSIKETIAHGSNRIGDPSPVRQDG